MSQPEPAPMPATRPRRDNTVYECGECQTRYLGEQWCVGCVRPCRRVGVGGLCPHCDEPVAIPDLLEAAETPAELEVITMPDRWPLLWRPLRVSSFGEQLWAVSVSGINITSGTRR